jgi:hypothetical protein
MTAQGRRRGKRHSLRTLRAAIAAAALVSALTAGTARAQETVTVFPNTPQLGNTYPFGEADTPSWTPFAAFFYRNIPAFELKPGDILAFDLRAMNNVDIQLEISLAATTTNGGTVEAEPFQTVVTNTQTPANPRGDATVGNFELQFTTEGPFSFPGGGLIIRFSNPSASFALDTMGSPVLVGGGAADATGFFVQRSYRDANGASPWSNEDPNSVGAFQLRIFPSPPDTDPPETTITGGPKNKTKKGRATFVFSSDEPGSSFDCSLDGKTTFKPCTSPFTVKVKKGKHTFQVQATDAAGNTDSTPASDDWKRKRKGKK